MGGTNPGRNMWVAIGIQTTLTNVATVYNYMQPTEVGGFLEEFANIESNRRLGTRFTGTPYLGTKQVPFSFTVEANPDDMGRIFAAAIGVGTMATTTSAYLHTWRFMESLPYCSVMGYLGGVADTSTAPMTMRLTGGKISKLSIRGAVDNILTASIEGIAMIASAFSATVGTFSSTDPWFLNSALGTGTLSIASTVTTPASFGEAREYEITIDNGISPDHRIHGSATPVGMSEGSSEITGRLAVIYNPTSFVEINNFAQGNLRAIALTVAGTKYMVSAPTQVRTLTIGVDACKYTGDTPSYDPDVITIDLPWKANVNTTSTYISILNDKSLPYNAAT